MASTREKKKKKDHNIPEIANSTKIPQHHANRLFGHLGRLPPVRGHPAVPRAHLVADEPPGRAHRPHGHDAQRVVQPRVAVGRVVLARDDARQRVEVALAAPHRVPPVRAGQAQRLAAAAAAAAGEEGLLLGFAVRDGRRVGVVRGRRREPAAAGAARPAAGVEGVVVGALADEDEVGEAEVGGESDGGRRELRPEGAGEVGNVAEQPDKEELHREGIGALGLVVCDELRELAPGLLAFAQNPEPRCIASPGSYQETYPRCEADAPKDAREGFPNRLSLEHGREAGDEGRHGAPMGAVLRQQLRGIASELQMEGCWPGRVHWPWWLRTEARCRASSHDSRRGRWSARPVIAPPLEMPGGGGGR